MNTIGKLKSITLEARKAKNPLAPVLQFHMSELANIGKVNQREVSEEETIVYLKKATQKLRENEFSNPEELKILESLLPEMCSEEDIESYLVYKFPNGAENKGIIMKALKEKFGVQIDMKIASGVVKKLYGI